MKQIFFTLIICLSASLSIRAQQPADSIAEDMPWYAIEDTPTCLDEKANALVADPASIVNTGGESFIEFLQKFQSDKAFRNSRLIGPEGAEPDTGLTDIFTYYDENNIPLDIEADYFEDQCSKIYSTFYGVQKNQVLYFSTENFDCDPDNPDEEALDGGGSAWYQFLRIEGKWYLRDVMVVG